MLYAAAAVVYFGCRVNPYEANFCIPCALVVSEVSTGDLLPIDLDLFINGARKMFWWSVELTNGVRDVHPVHPTFLIGLRIVLSHNIIRFAKRIGSVRGRKGF